MRKYVGLIVHYLVGFVFVFSAITKLIDFEEFQVFVYSLDLFNLNLSILVSQFIVGLEFSIGLLFLFKIYTRLVSLFSILLIAFFTVFVLYLKFSNLNTDCHCFGSAIQFSANATIVKNIVLLLAVFYIYFRGIELKTRFKPMLLCFALAIGFLSTILVHPPDFLYSFNYKTENYYSTSDLAKFAKKNRLTNQKKVLCFLSTECKYCKLAAKKMTIISKKSNNKKAVYFVFWSLKNNSNSFYKETNSYPFQFVNLNVIEFLKICNGTMPLIVLYNKGKVEKAFRYKDLDENQILKFLDEN